MGLLAAAASPSPLATRGYAVLPVPQRVMLGQADFPFGAGWRLELRSVASGDIAVSSLMEGLSSRFHIKLSDASKGKTITLALIPGSVTIGEALDSNKQSLAEQAYLLELRAATITITANAPIGLFYGVQTLVQLLRPRDGALWLPEGEILDWPDLRLRQIYWDDAHHLDRPEVLRAAIRQAAFYKINGFVIKLEGHFQYRSAPAIVEPYALASAELQSLTDYALRYHVQLIPYLDGPAHIAFILKHPEYTGLREFADSNYEACAVNPDVYKLYEGLFRDLLDANRGVKYFYLSTDEPYYIGLSRSSRCDEAARAKELGSVGNLLGDFVTKTAGWLHEHGREVIFWGEYPMKPQDVTSAPAYMINGETYGPEFDPVFRRHGIRQTIYVSTQGEERHFPGYFLLPPEQRLHPETNRRAAPRVEEIVRKISADPSRKDADLMGVVNAGWADAGLHPETFWLGYAAGTAAAWHPAPPDADELTNAFYRIFYGWKAEDLDRVYRLMSWQSQFWSDSWETGPSQSRKPIWGNSNLIYNPRRPARDQFIPLPPGPRANLKYDSTWSRDNARRLELATEFLKQNGELRDLLIRNLQLVDFNRYNLEVFLSIASLLRHNLTMIEALGRIDGLLRSAQERAEANQPRDAVAAVDQTLNLARSVREEQDTMLRDLTRVWYQSWYPRVAEANGRKFLHELDDVKDHPADRTVDLSYIMQREFLLPLGEWEQQVRAARNQYAEANHVH
jgi:hypothetical protein